MVAGARTPACPFAGVSRDGLAAADVESGRFAAAADPDGDPDEDDEAMIEALELFPDGAGIGSGICAEADGAAVTSTGTESSPSGQFGLSSTDVVPRRNTTSVAASSGSVPLLSPLSCRRAL